MPFVDRCIFTPTSAGTGDFVVSAAVSGYQTPAQASAVNGLVYSYAAQLSDLSAWEVGQGALSGTTLARTTIIASSNGGSKVNFSAAPAVMLTALAEDMLAKVASAPVSNTSNGETYQFAFDGSGNLYICYAANTWAKYTNVAPFGPSSDAQPLGMP